MKNEINKNNKENKFTWLNLIKAVFYLLGDKKRSYVLWSIARFLTFFHVIIPPLIIGLTVDFFTTYQKGDSLNKLYVYSFILGFSSIVMLIVRAVTKRHLLRICNFAYLYIRVKGFEKLVSLSLKKHDNENTGAKVQKIQNGVLSFRLFLRIMENKIYSSTATFIGTVTVFIFLSPIYILFFVAYLIIFFVVLKIFYKKIQYYNYKHNLVKEKASGVYIEGLSNILSIKSTGAEMSFKNHISDNEEVSKKIGDKVVDSIMDQWSWFHVLNSLSMGLFLFLIGRGIISGAISIGSVVIIFSYFERLIAASTDILSIYQDLIESKTGVERMMPIFWNKTEKQTGDRDFLEDWNKIKISDANFTYRKEEKDEFHTGVYGIDLEINKNEKIGFAGKTGSGKSTMAKLLVGLYPVDSGKYFFDNVNFYDVKPEKMLENISIVLQESEMFNFSLKDNITLMHEFDEELFWKAIKIAQLEKVLEKMPNGVDTLIGEKGYHLSGGERQRVGIARAIYRDAQIMIFDEATSSLDNRTEQLIQEALEKELRKKTLIFIAHRITTLKNVDRIYVFKNGKIVEQGKYEELLNNPEREFYRIFNKKGDRNSPRIR